MATDDDICLARAAHTGKVGTMHHNLIDTRTRQLAPCVCCAVIVACSFAAYRAIGDTSPATSGTKDAAPQKRGIIITISDEITDVTTESIERRVELAKQNGVDVIIFELDTPGGYVTSALDICSYIKNLEHIHTVAWVNTDAYSAGSMISVACNEIVMARSSVLGDCGVILGGPTGPAEVPEQLRAKAESPVLEQFRDSARLRDYDILLCESMVVKEREVYWIENTTDGTRKFVDPKEKDELIGGGDKTTLLGIEVPNLGLSNAKWRLVESYEDPTTGTMVDLEQPVVSTTELLTMSQSRAHAFGFSKGIVTGEEDLRERYNLTGPIERIDFTRSEVLTRWMTSMPVRGFLMLIVLLGAYVEFNTPGVGVPGAVALIALGIFLGAPYVTGLANIWEILLVVVGLVLIAVEVFVIPGFGIAGISGILLLIIGLLATFMPDEPGRLPIYWPQLQPGLDGLKAGVQTIGAAMGLSIVGMVMLSRYLPRLPYLRSIIPANPTPSDVMIEDPYRGAALVGDVGSVVGQLRPAGKARFGERLVDVVTEGDLIDDGERVEVVERRGNRVVVRRIKSG